MDNLKSKSKHALAWDFSGRLISQGVGFIVSIFLARLLTPEDFGLVAIAHVIIAFSQIFIDMGLGMSIVQRKELTSPHYGSVFWFNMFSGAALTTGLWFCAPLLENFFQAPGLKEVTEVLSLVFVLNAFGRVINARLNKDLRMKIQVIAQLVAGIISGAIGVWMAFNEYGVWALVVQTLLFAGINNLLLFVLAGYGPMLQFQWSALKELWGFGLHMFTAGFLNKLFNQLDSLIIGKLFAIGILGQFNRARSLQRVLVNDLSGSLSRVMMPVLSSVQDDDDRFLSIVDRSLSIASFFGFFMAGALWVTSRDAVLLVYGWQWEYAAEMFGILMLSGYTYPINSILVFINASKGHSKRFLIRAILQRIVQGTNLIIGFSFGIEPFLYGLIAVSVIALSINIFFSTKEVSVGQLWFHKKIWGYGGLSIIAAATAYLIAYQFQESLTVHALIGGGVFVILYFALNALIQSRGYIIFLEELKPLTTNMKFWK